MRTLQLAVVVAAFAAAGCGGPSSLEGVVNLDGQPLDEAVVVLTPTAPGADIVVGTTGPDGRFVVTPSAERSIAPGVYKVTVSKRKEKPNKKPRAAVPPPPEPDFPGAGSEGIMALPPETLPPRFSDLSLTELKVTIPTDGEVTFDLSSR